MHNNKQTVNNECISLRTNVSPGLLCVNGYFIDQTNPTLSALGFLFFFETVFLLFISLFWFIFICVNENYVFFSFCSFHCSIINSSFRYIFRFMCHAQFNTCHSCSCICEQTYDMIFNQTINKSFNMFVAIKSGRRR